jgi:hypothetical protein
MRRSRFSFKEHFPILEFRLLRGPFALIKVGDRNLELIRVNRVKGKFIITRNGVFELDGEYELRLFNQSFYLYNLHNSKPLSLRAIEEIQKDWRERKFSRITSELKRVDDAISADETAKQQGMSSHASNSSLKVLEHMSKSQEKGELHNETIKFLVDHKTFDESDVKLILADALTEKKLNPMMSNNVGTTLPTVIFSAIGIAVVILMMNLPHWLHWF